MVGLGGSGRTSRCRALIMLLQVTRNGKGGGEKVLLPLRAATHPSNTSNQGHHHREGGKRTRKSTEGHGR